MAKAILVANWKNHPKSLSEAKSLLKKLARSSRIYKRLTLFIAPPYAYLDQVSAASSFSRLASQDVASVLQGTHTGLITPDILKSFGVRLSIIGHSERRALGETNEIVSEKIKVALRAGLMPLVCVGEISHDQDGEHFEFLREQIKLSLASVRKADASKLMIAYEPVWAIGKKASEAIKPADLSQAVMFIKKILVDMFGRATGEGVPILYGGSVEPADARELWSGTGVSGFLVGHASLKAEDFKIIAESLLTK